MSMLVCHETNVCTAGKQHSYDLCLRSLRASVFRIDEVDLRTTPTSSHKSPLPCSLSHGAGSHCIGGIGGAAAAAPAAAVTPAGPALASSAAPAPASLSRCNKVKIAAMGGCCRSWCRSCRRSSCSCRCSHRCCLCCCWHGGSWWCWWCSSYMRSRSRIIRLSSSLRIFSCT